MMFMPPPTPLLISDIQAPQNGPVAAVIVTANIPGAVHRYHWYADGNYVGPTVEPRWGEPVELGARVEVVCIPTRYPDFDAQANEPRSYPAAQTIEWNSPEGDSEVDFYRIDHATGESEPSENDWSEIGRRPRTAVWAYLFTTATLADLTWHWLRVVPVGLNGNDGTALVVTPKTQHVRRPDSPDLATAFDDGTQKLTWSAA